MRKILVLGLLFGTLAAWNTGCTGDDDDDDDHTAPDSIAVTPANPSVNVGSSIQLTATGTFPDMSTEDLTTTSTWTTNSANIATVGANTGLVTGVAAGTATITADHDGVMGFTTVTVTTGAALADLTFNGQGWPHDGFTAFVRILEGTNVVDCAESAAIAGNMFSVTFADILTPGVTYTYETFADLDSDGQYDDALADHSWTATFQAVAGTTEVDVAHGTQTALTWAADTGCPGT